jgi:hypothetical protein
LPWGKHSKLLRKSVNYGQKSFITLTPKSNNPDDSHNANDADEQPVVGVRLAVAQHHETFLTRNFRFDAIS